MIQVGLSFPLTMKAAESDSLLSDHWALPAERVAALRTLHWCCLLQETLPTRPAQYCAPLPIRVTSSTAHCPKPLEICLSVSSHQIIGPRRTTCT